MQKEKIGVSSVISHVSVLGTVEHCAELSTTTSRHTLWPFNNPRAAHCSKPICRILLLSPIYRIVYLGMVHSSGRLVHFIYLATIHRICLTCPTYASNRHQSRPRTTPKEVRIFVQACYSRWKDLGHNERSALDPGFLKGYVRRFAQSSSDHRGTPEVGGVPALLQPEV